MRLVGVHAVEVAKVAWNVYILSGSTSKQPLWPIKAVLHFAKDVIGVSLAGARDGTSSPDKDAEALANALEDELAMVGR